MKYLFLICIAIGISSCIYSFHPLHSKDKLVDMPHLEGKYQQDRNGPFGASDTVYWEFQREDIGTYHVILTQSDAVGSFDGHVVRLGEEYFIDLLPDEVELNSIPEFVAWHLAPVHTFSRIRIQDGGFSLEAFDYEWLLENLSSHRIRMDYLERKDVDNETEFIMLSADTPELQKFVAKYSRLDEAFGDPDLLMKIPD